MRWLARAHQNPARAQSEWAEHGIALLPLGRRFDAVRIPAVLVRAALAANGTVDGPLLLDPHSGNFYALVPPQTTETWVCAFGTCLGRGAWLGVPHPERVAPPGPHWTVRGSEPSSLCGPHGVRELIELGHREIEGACALPSAGTGSGHNGSPQDDSNRGNKHGGGGSDEGGNTNDGRRPADGK